MALPETTAEWLERYQKKYERAYWNYQDSGDPKYNRQVIEYDAIRDAFSAKLSREADRGDELLRRTRNMNAATEKLIKDTYTRDEVVELLRNAIWW